MRFPKDDYLLVDEPISDIGKLDELRKIVQSDEFHTTIFQLLHSSDNSEVNLMKLVTFFPVKKNMKLRDKLTKVIRRENNWSEDDYTR